MMATTASSDQTRLMMSWTLQMHSIAQLPAHPTRQQGLAVTHQAAPFDAPRLQQHACMTRHKTQVAPWFWSNSTRQYAIPANKGQHRAEEAPTLCLLRQCTKSAATAPSTAHTCFSGNTLIGGQQLVALRLHQLVTLLQSPMVVAQSLQASEG